MLFACVSIATVVVLCGLALRSLIDGVAEHLEADDVSPKFRRPAYRLVSGRATVRAVRVYPTKIGQRFTQASLGRH